MHMEEVYEGEPWFGRSVKALLKEVDAKTALIKPSGQHSILELVWHMINWKEFTISRLDERQAQPMKYFEENDWRQLDHTDASLWTKGLKRFEELHHELVKLTKNLPEASLEKIVTERKYNFRQLLNGIIEHDIYHVGQVAFVRKLL